MSDETTEIFTDRRDREITFVVESDVIGHARGREIARMEFDFDDDGNAFLCHVSVNQDYQRAGIGTEMVRRAVKLYGRRFGRPSFSAVGGSGRSSCEYFTQDGAALFSSCIRKDIIDDIYKFDEASGE